MAALDPQNHGQARRIFTIIEDSSMDGLIIGAGQEVRFDGAAHTVTLTNLTVVAGGKFNRGAHTIIGFNGGVSFEEYVGILRIYNNDTRIAQVAISGNALVLTSVAGSSSFSIENGNAQASADLGVTGVLSVGGYNLAALPSIQDNGVIMVGDAPGGQSLYFSDLSNWKQLTSIVADTGWTANSDSGTKTAVIGSSATISGMTAALNVVLAGFGTQFAAVAEKVKALETALAANLLPNA